MAPNNHMKNNFVCFCFCNAHISIGYDGATHLDTALKHALEAQYLNKRLALILLSHLSKQFC